MSETVNLNGGRAVVECLKAENVEYVFGVPGGQTLAIMDALYDTPEIKFITAHHEGGAACMADGYARRTGRPGVCLVTTGPGATNMLTGVGGAQKDSSPVIFMTANNRAKDFDRDDAQEADHVALFRPLTKWSLMVTDAVRIPEAMREAFRRALTGCPGPVHLDFARDALEDGKVNFTPVEPARYRPQGRVQGDPETIASAAAVLREARAPTIWSGRGVIVSRATEALAELADATESALVTTYNGIGSVPAGHRLAFGPKSRHGTKLTTEILRRSDVLVVIGNSLNASSTGRWTLELTDKVIHIDADPEMVGRHYPFEVGIVGDAQAVLNDLVTAVAECAPRASVLQERRERIETLRGEHAEWRASVFKPEYANARPIKPYYLMEALQKALPKRAIVVGGAGNPGIWTNLLEIHETGTYMKPVGFGNMGFGLPAAIGAKLADASRPVVAVVGDGSLGMCISEIETAVREKAPLVLLIMNNFCYGNIKQEQLAHFGPRYIGVDFTDINFVEIARGFGATGERVEDPGGLDVALKRAFESGETYVLDVVIDPDDSVWTEPF